MLPNSFRPIGFNTFEKEGWPQYQTRLRLPENEAVLQFYRQVVYDHFEHFNDHYPDFELEDYSIEMREYSAQEANDLIRFFGSEVMGRWGEQYDHFVTTHQNYVIFQSMSKMDTFPFPPIIIDPSLIGNMGRNECGRPLHLIEGTHRVSYLRHMLARGLVLPSSRHQFVLLQPK